MPGKHPKATEMMSEGDAKEVTGPIIPLPCQSEPKMSAHEPSLDVTSLEDVLEDREDKELSDLDAFNVNNLIS